MSEAIITQEKLDALYARVGVNHRGGILSMSLYAPVDIETVHGVECNGVTSFKRWKVQWRDLMSFIAKLPATPNLSILVTAMSIGCQLYSAAKAAELAGVFERHSGATLYGHDISPLFTELADIGFYHKSEVERHANWESMFDPSEFEGYLQVKPSLRERVKILKPTNILDLEGRFDVCVSHFMNPHVPRLNEKFTELSRHFSVTLNYKDHLDGDELYICGLSEEWNHSRSSVGFYPPVNLRRPLFKWQGMYDKKVLPGSSVPIQIPEFFDPAGYV